MADALVYKGANTKIVDLKGRTMLPGFIDPHIHMCFTMFRHWLDMSPFVNADMEQIK
jgi:predicted amidohydrolase YtcJ